nr:MAG TPA: hypothetical protein [Caudoviricetes sp.]
MLFEFIALVSNLHFQCKTQFNASLTLLFNALM